MKITYLIVPAWSDQAGRCRIVCREHDAEVRPGLNDYRNKPDLWKDCGVMNSQGAIVALDPNHPSHRLHMKQDEPLMAGVCYTFEVDS